MKTLLLIPALATLAFAGCATEPQHGEKLAREEAYAPTGTLIPRKNGQGVGPTAIGTVNKQEAENARAMQSNGLAGMPAG